MSVRLVNIMVISVVAFVAHFRMNNPAASSGVSNSEQP